MIRPELNGYSIAKGVRAFSSTRRGGVSNGPFRAFNINAFCGDDPASVAENRKALAAELGISADHIVMPHQIHGTECLQIDETWLAYTAAQRCQKAEGYDAVMTRLRGVCIGVSTADCIPLLLYDAEHDAIAAAHAGWRGTVKRIAEHTIRRMQQAYGTQPSGLQLSVPKASIWKLSPAVSANGISTFRPVTDCNSWPQACRPTAYKWQIAARSHMPTNTSQPGNWA